MAAPPKTKALARRKQLGKDRRLADKGKPLDAEIEIVETPPMPEPASEQDVVRVFRGIGAGRIDKDKAVAVKVAAFNQDRSLDKYSILPTGELYIDHVKYRTLLNDLFGMNGWGIRPMGKVFVDDLPKGQIMYREFVLVVNNRIVSEAIGAAKFYSSNPRQDYGVAYEICKSLAVHRLVKPLGLGLEVYDRKWCRAFRTENAVQVWVEKNVKNDETGQWHKGKAKHWRMRIDDQFDGELCVVGEEGASGYEINRDGYPIKRSIDAPAAGMISEEQRKNIIATARATKIDDEETREFLGTLGYATTASIPVTAYDDVIKKVEQWAKEKSKSKKSGGVAESGQKSLI